MTGTVTPPPAPTLRERMIEDMKLHRLSGREVKLADACVRVYVCAQYENRAFNPLDRKHRRRWASESW
jgi:hypothetical protein